MAAQIATAATVVLTIDEPNLEKSVTQRMQNGHNPYDTAKSSMDCAKSLILLNDSTRLFLVAKAHLPAPLQDSIAEVVNVWPAASAGRSSGTFGAVVVGNVVPAGDLALAERKNGIG